MTPGESNQRDTLEVEGSRISYETRGRGPPLLFLHSVIADSRMWDREMSAYSGEHQTVRFDLRGFGGSPPATRPFSYSRDLVAIIEHLRLERPWLVGSSAGGAIALRFALSHPDLTSGLFLLAPGLGFPPPYDPEETAAFEYDDQKSKEVSETWSKGDPGRAFELLRQLWCAALTGPNLDHFRRMVTENSLEVYESRSEQQAEPEPPAAARLPQVKVPTTILVGDRDNPSMPFLAKRVARAIPGARLVTVPGADHLLNLSRPQEVDDELTFALRAAGPRP